MRKRAQRKGKLVIEEPKRFVQKSVDEAPSFRFKKQWLTAIFLVGIFFIVLLFNAYFNASSGISINNEGEGFSKFYLSGPDPYYNMRLVNQTLYGENPGEYPYYSDYDPLLNYPIGHTGGRRPLLNMMAIGFGRLLSPFMDEVDAVGYSMQFIPALFGALLVFPVYFIGKTLFGKKEGILAALFIALIPIHLGSGHGSAYSLFDHDSFNLFLYFVTFYFLIKSIKEKNTVKSVIYALLGGIPLASLSMTWVEARYLYVIIAIYAIVQMVVDIFKNKIQFNVFSSTSILLFSGYLISLPVIAARYGGFRADIPLFLCLGVTAFGAIYYIFKLKKLPWTLTLPAVFVVAIIALAFLYFVKDLSSIVPGFSSLSTLSNILYGSGIYGSKVAMTIAEAGTYAISRTVMSFGPAFYWLGFFGFAFMAYLFYKDPQRRDFLFIITFFVIQIWLTGVAGRFLNDLVPLIAILGGWIIWVIVDKIDYKQMIRTIKSSGGGFRGIRRGFKFIHITGIVFIGFLVVFPNAYLSFDAAIPSVEKEDAFGDYPSGVFGLGHYKEQYWVNAYTWLSSQDNQISKPSDRPAYISWWDYGFYEVAVGEHPTVADNFQDGIPPAANFHTAISEEEAVAVWIVRLLEGYVEKEGSLSTEVEKALEKNLGKNDTIDIKSWVENPEISPSYGKPIGEEYNPELSQHYTVGEEWKTNAIYHDVTKLIVDRLDDEQITCLYCDIQDATGFSIRYYGVEGYDKQIFNIFTFLADKSLLLVSGGGAYNPEDDFIEFHYVTQKGKELTFEELENLTDQELRLDPPVNTKAYYKDAYFDTMFYRTWVGPTSGESGSKSEPNYQLPCINMRHFCAEFISDINKYPYYSGSKSAVVIAKYYAGAFINGSVYYNGEPLNVQVVVQKNISHYGVEIPIDHDKTSTVNGTFSAIAPEGNITIQIRRYPELDAGAFALKNITFNGVGDLAPITDEEASRKGENYERFINVTIDPANLEGFVYDNLDNYTAYNASIDTPLPDIEIVVLGIETFDPDTGQPQQYDYSNYNVTTTDNKGFYSIQGLKPGYYRLLATIDDFLIEDAIIPLGSGNNSNNISKPKSGNVEGTIYYDGNDNGKYDEGEEVSNVNVSLRYTKLNGEIKIVDSLVTDTTGKYSFISLVPGNYIINATKYPVYETEDTITVSENVTEFYNLSLAYAYVTVSGYTRYNDTGSTIENVTIGFEMDGSVVNNTAEPKSVTSDNEGYFKSKLYPGSYNVTVTHMVNESGIDVLYVYEGQITIQVGEISKSYEILLDKEELI
jgi:asparagine N-glycosylation enzyme membrane subunit Stt3